jgi:acetyltransferase-like isoleucine patch superfamily enzyme
MQFTLGRLAAKALQELEQRTRSIWYRYVRFAWMRFGRGVVFSGPLHSLGSTGTVIIGDRAFFGPWVTLSVADGGALVVGNNVSINKSCVISALKRVEIGDGCRIGENVSIRDNDHRISGREPILGSGFKSEPIVIGANVWIGRNVTILPGVVIGEGAVIGAHALVNRRVEPFSIMVGTPAKKIAER